MLRFRDLSASFSRFWGLRFRSKVLRFRDRVLRFRSRVLRFRDLGASFSSFGCFVLRSSFSSASFSKLPSFFSDFICFAENQKVLTSTCYIHLGK